ncbi:transketolase [Blastomonas sp.]|uniref:transketolase n=1 Tax=Blastomonas sp. TaxID=1909299 RepID=UPI00406A8D24
MFDPVSLRKTILEMAFAGSTVHIGCAFSIVELLAVLYRNHLAYPGNDPLSPERDYLVLSKGHGVMAQYACMYELGWLQHDVHIQKYFSDGSELKGLSDSRVPGLEVTSGSLGHGFSVGVGIAMGLKRRASDRNVFAIVGDGEINEGPIWEGMLVAAHHKLDNLMIIVDANGFQAMGRTEDVLHLGNLAAKFESFDFVVREVDGHNEPEIDSAIRELLADQSGRPKALLATTVKGKGLSFMEHENKWHYTRLDADTFDKAIAELSAMEPIV